MELKFKEGKSAYVIKDVKSIEDMDLLFEDTRLSTAKMRISFYTEEAWLAAKKLFTEEVYPYQRFDEDGFVKSNSLKSYCWILTRCNSFQISL